MLNKANIKDAVYLIDVYSFRNVDSQWGIPASFDYCGDGEGPETPVSREYLLLNSDRDGEVVLRRDCRGFEGGLLTFEMFLDHQNGDGLYIAFGSRTDAFLELIVKNKALYIGDTKVAEFPYGKHYIKLYIDMVSEKVKILLDTKTRGIFEFNKPVFLYNCLRIGYGERDRGSTELYEAKLYINYLVNDACLNRYVGDLSDEYEVMVPEGCSVISERYLEYEQKNREREYAYTSRNRKGAATVAKRTFEQAGGMVVFEMMYLMLESRGKMTAALLSGSEKVVSVSDEGEALYCSCGRELRRHHKNVWQTLRIYADTKKQCAEIWLNGKKTEIVPFENPAQCLDNFTITYEADEQSSFMFSHMLLWRKPEEPVDYVPVPMIPEKKGDYVVGMNICSLWRLDHFAGGWDCISAFDDAKPVLGFYDEGLPETADWEIKYQVEHGIDYALYCWYSSESKSPIRKSRFSHALTEGYFYAKYADMEKFAILWEAVNGVHPTCLEDFKGNVVPYWLDYFFSDPRYMQVDNKAVMSCFGVRNAVNDLGGEEAFREGLLYLREEVKKLGYDDLIIMASHADPKDLKRLGFDAFHAYHWSRGGQKLEVNIQKNVDYTAKKAVHVVPTISVGFKDTPWYGERNPNLSCQDMYRALTYCIDHILPEYEQGTWKAKMLHLSSWNEYGEGTYIMPSGLNGFGYLDAVRKAVCVDAPHEDMIPTGEQKARIGYLYPAGRSRLRRTEYDVRPLLPQDTVVAQYTFTSEEELKKWTFRDMTNVRIEGGCLCGDAVSAFPEMELKHAGLDASRIAYVKIRMKNSHALNGNPTEACLMVSNVPEMTGYTRWLRNSYTFYCSSGEVKEYTLQLDVKPCWTNTIHGICLAPTHSGSFKIESITFYAALPHITVYGKDGRQLFFGDYPEEKNGDIFVPLDPVDGAREYLPQVGNGSVKRYGLFLNDLTNSVIHAIGYKFEWFKEEGRLELWKAAERVTLVVGKAYAVKNGESYTLVKPVYLKDGIPTVALRDMEWLFGVKYIREGNKIWLN